jgi:phosphoenolpyruvate phosphomutase
MTPRVEQMERRVGNKALRLAAAVESQNGQPVLMVGVHNALAAQLAERSGFDAGWISGFEVSASLGIPDRNLLGCTEMAEVTRRVTMATDLPVLVDADNGYGSALAMRRAADEFVLSDAAGMCVEDSMFPKRNSFDPARDGALADAGEFADWIAETKQHLTDCSFLVVGRTEALIAGRSVETALDRARRYADAGADLVVVHSKDRSGREATEVAQRWHRPTPLVTIPTAFPQMSPGELGSLGYRMVIYANHVLRAAATGMRDALTALSAGKPASLDAGIMSMRDIFQLTTDRAEFGTHDQWSGNQRQREGRSYPRRVDSAGPL